MFFPRINVHQNVWVTPASSFFIVPDIFPTKVLKFQSTNPASSKPIKLHWGPLTQEEGDLTILSMQTRQQGACVGKKGFTWNTVVNLFDRLLLHVPDCQHPNFFSPVHVGLASAKNSVWLSLWPYQRQHLSVYLAEACSEQTLIKSVGTLCRNLRATTLSRAFQQRSYERGREGQKTGRSSSYSWLAKIGPISWCTKCHTKYVLNIPSITVLQVLVFHF